MDKQKRIEEIFNDIVEISNKEYYYDNKGHCRMDFVDLDNLAQRLAEKYQPKIPQNMVILTREELLERDERLKRFETQITEVKIRKEAAKDIYNEIDDSDILVIQTQEYGEIEVVPMERLKEIIKQKGVKVDYEN